MSTAWNSAKIATTTAFNNIKTAMSTALGNAVGIVRSKCSSILSGMTGVFGGVYGTFSSIGANVINGIIGGISSMVGSLYGSIKSALSGLVNKAKAALGIHSPSRVFRDMVGKYIPEGIAVGIDTNTESAEDSMIGMTDRVLKGARAFHDKFSNFMNVEPTAGYNLALAGAGDIRAGGMGTASSMAQKLNPYNQSTIQTTEIHIEKIEVRDDKDLDMLTEGMYNRQDQNLRALGRRSNL